MIAALIIGYTGDVTDITRFATAGHFAAYNGTAPIEFSSSGHTAHRLSRRGNRTLKHAIHMIAVTQIRHARSEGVRGTLSRVDLLSEAPLTVRSTFTCWEGCAALCDPTLDLAEVAPKR